MTERSPAPKAQRSPPRLDLTAVEWKLGLAAALASAFTAAWFTVAQPKPAATAPAPVAAAASAPVVAPAVASATPRRVIAPAATARAPSAVTAVAVARPRRSLRVRTRSS